ncbi:MAG: hypothetical protein OEM67_06135 [Thermoleophilia bacterium]|nr:hypothetical protein [Thermoleophilia bacterium]
MEIEEFTVVLEAADFDRTCRFYGEVMSLPRLRSWSAESGRRAVFRAGTGLIEIKSGVQRRKPARSMSDGAPRPTLTLTVSSAQEAYERLIFREKNIPGGLKTEPDGRTVFETHDPDGVVILLSEPE